MAESEWSIEDHYLKPAVNPGETAELMYSEMVLSLVSSQVQ